MQQVFEINTKWEENIEKLHFSSFRQHGDIGDGFDGFDVVDKYP